MDRTWMYNRLNANRHGLQEKFVRGVKNFVKKALKQPICISEGGISTAVNVRLYLYKFGFQPNYWIWTKHGEVKQSVDTRGGSNSLMEIPL
ncbi:hypothetical protein TSUD_240550 [Trifolium subterraneum]|uniref:Transposase-associated domain-containing protein n=1 Tax=Trifolium subterraneum TaxID=3900 RepID=A0A2Z6PU20_TRISU|nr:hypothetical protein TSUD_240550 [Trifolium subterraneum]